MGRMLQIRNVPESVHRKLKVRAVEAGMSLSDYVLAEVSRLAELPTMEEWRARLAALPQVKIRPSAASAVRQERDLR